MLSPATPLLSVILPACTIAYKSDEAVFHDQPILYVLMFGFIAAKITNRLVVSVPILSFFSLVVCFSKRISRIERNS